MVMVFTLVSAGQEWLNEKWDSIKKDREEQILAKKKADEEAEQVIFFKHLLYFPYMNHLMLMLLISYKYYSHVKYPNNFV